MSDNVGLSTPRGSGTSGYVQRNLAHMRPRDRAAPYPPTNSSGGPDALRHRHRQPDRGILEHDRKREVEVEVLELRDQLEDDGLDEDEIDKRCDALRKDLLAKLTANHHRNSSSGSGRQPPGPVRRDHQGQTTTTMTKKLKPHQVHELADAKIRESERLRTALRIGRDYEEGGHWRRQEERQRKARERELQEQQEQRQQQQQAAEEEEAEDRRRDNDDGGGGGDYYYDDDNDRYRDDHRDAEPDERYAGRGRDYD